MIIVKSKTRKDRGTRPNSLSLCGPFSNFQSPSHSSSKINFQSKKEYQTKDSLSDFPPQQKRFVLVPHLPFKFSRLDDDQSLEFRTVSHHISREKNFLKSQKKGIFCHVVSFKYFKYYIAQIFE